MMVSASRPVRTRLFGVRQREERLLHSDRGAMETTPAESPSPCSKYPCSRPRCSHIPVPCATCATSTTYSVAHTNGLRLRRATIFCECFDDPTPTPAVFPSPSCSPVPCPSPLFPVLPISSDICHLFHRRSAATPLLLPPYCGANDVFHRPVPVGERGTRWRKVCGRIRVTFLRLAFYVPRRNNPTRRRGNGRIPSDGIASDTLQRFVMGGSR